MHKLLTKYGLAAHLAILAVAPLFLSATAVLWLSAIAAVWVVMEPSRIGAEMLHSARARVWKKIVEDPVLWVMLSVAVFTGIETLNGGVSLAYDAETLKWSVSSPAMPMLPGSVDGCGFAEFAAAIAATVVLQGIRSALGRSARGAFLLVSSLLSGVGAVVMSMMISEGVPSAVLASKCDISEPSFIGSIFGVYLSFAVCAISIAQEKKWFMAMPVAMFAAGANAVGLFIFAPAGIFALFAGVALLTVLYAIVYARIKIGVTAEFKYFIFFAFPVVLALLAVVFTVDPEIVADRTAAYSEGNFRPEGFTEARQITSSIAKKVWKADPWLGSGLGSFALDMKYHALPTDWMIVSPVQRAPLNGFWMILAERGVIGAFVLAVPLVLLLVFYFIRMFGSFGARMPEASCMIGIPVLSAYLAEAFVDATCVMPGMLLAVVAALSISACSFPKEKRNGR